MSARPRGRGAIVAAAVVYASCSLLGLDEIDQATCADDTQCDVLNALHAERIDACVRYRCDPVQQICKRLPIDADGDGVPPPECGTTPVDCDDADAARAPLQAERCDGVDNDCDLVIDEEGIASTASIAIADLPAAASLRASVSAEGFGAIVSWTAGGAAGGDELTGPPDPAVMPGSGEEIEYERRTLGYLGSGLAASDPTPASCPRRVVEVPVMQRDGGAPSIPCAAHEHCQDGVFCNGYERCAALLPSGGPDAGMADDAGCVLGAPRSACAAAAEHLETTCTEPSSLSPEDLDDTCAFEAGTDCTFAALALGAVSPRRWIGATVSTLGCAQGRLLVGWLDPMSTPPHGLVLNGLLEGPNLHFGLPETCSGEGASGLALATLALDDADTCSQPGEARRALVAWLATSAASPPLPDACAAPGTATDVMGIGAWLAEEGPATWVHPSNNGAPISLGTTGGLAPPAVVAWPGRGWFVAYADEGGAIALQFASALGCYPRPDGASHETEPLDPDPPQTLFASGSTGPADQISLAVGRSLAGREVELGVAWRRGCGGDARVLFGIVRVQEGTIEMRGPIEVAEGSTRAAHSPVVAWTETGFLEPGAPGGRADRASGGWLVVWLEGDSLLGRRYSGETDAPIDDAPFVIASRAASPFLLGVRDAATLVGFHDRSDRAVRVGAGCGPSATP